MLKKFKKKNFFSENGSETNFFSASFDGVNNTQTLNRIPRFRQNSLRNCKNKRFDTWSASTPHDIAMVQSVIANSKSTKKRPLSELWRFKSELQINLSKQVIFFSFKKQGFKLIIKS